MNTPLTIERQYPAASLETLAELLRRLVALAEQRAGDPPLEPRCPAVYDHLYQCDYFQGHDGMHHCQRCYW